MSGHPAHTTHSLTAQCTAVLSVDKHNQGPDPLLAQTYFDPHVHGLEPQLRQALTDRIAVGGMYASLDSWREEAGITSEEMVDLVLDPAVMAHDPEHYLIHWDKEVLPMWLNTSHQDLHHAYHAKLGALSQGDDVVGAGIRAALLEETPRARSAVEAVLRYDSAVSNEALARLAQQPAPTADTIMPLDVMTRIHVRHARRHHEDRFSYFQPDQELLARAICLENNTHDIRSTLAWTARHADAQANGATRYDIDALAALAVNRVSRMQSSSASEHFYKAHERAPTLLHSKPYALSLQNFHRNRFYEAAAQDASIPAAIRAATGGVAAQQCLSPEEQAWAIASGYSVNERDPASLALGTSQTVNHLYAQNPLAFVDQCGRERITQHLTHASFPPLVHAELLTVTIGAGINTEAVRDTAFGVLTEHQDELTEDCRDGLLCALLDSPDVSEPFAFT